MSRHLEIGLIYWHIRRVLQWMVRCDLGAVDEKWHMRSTRKFEAVTTVSTIRQMQGCSAGLVWYWWVLVSGCRTSKRSQYLWLHRASNQQLYIDNIPVEVKERPTMLLDLPL